MYSSSTVQDNESDEGWSTATHYNSDCNTIILIESDVNDDLDLALYEEVKNSLKGQLKSEESHHKEKPQQALLRLNEQELEFACVSSKLREEKVSLAALFYCIKPLDVIDLCPQVVGRLGQLHHGKPAKKKCRTCTKVQLPRLELKILSEGRWLTDRHIDATCALLRGQFQDARGLQCPLLGQNLSFLPVEPPFVQILHIGGNHWNTVVAIDTQTVKVYDSLYHSLDAGTSKQSAAILRSSCKQISFSIENTQEQIGGSDCGLFAIAYATEYCYGNAPECYRFVTVHCCISF